MGKKIAVWLHRAYKLRSTFNFVLSGITMAMLLKIYEAARAEPTLLTFVAIALVISTLWFFANIIRFFIPREWVEVYNTQEELVIARGAISKELLHTKSILMVVNTGKSLVDEDFFLNEQITSKIKRFIVRAPDNPANAVQARTSKTVSEASIVADIDATVKNARGKFPIKYLIENVNLPSMVIVNHRKHDAWARIVVPITGIEAKQQFSIVIRKNENRELFRRVRKAFNDAWHNKTLTRDV